MTFEQSPHATLDAIIRKARYLLISFDGPIRSTSTGNRPAPHIGDVLSACRESGRSAAVVTATPAEEVRAYLGAHDLFTSIAAIAASIGQAASALETSLADCTVITSSPSDVEAAQTAGVPVIAYAKARDDTEHLAQAGASALAYSLTNVALTLRAFPM